jgi:hypothetical protein
MGKRLRGGWEMIRLGINEIFELPSYCHAMSVKKISRAWAKRLIGANGPPRVNFKVERNQ